MDEAMGQSTVSGAPTGRQSQNGLAEIKWKHTMNMVSNWLTSNYLPKRFWYFALRAAAQPSLRQAQSGCDNPPSNGRQSDNQSDLRWER
eukprot:10725502-Ditylum_brightwellii.AAC.1